MKDLEERLIKCFACAFPDLPAAKLSQSSQNSLVSWDSLTTVNLLSLIEEEFDIVIPAEDIEHFTSFAGILGYLQSR